MSEPRIGEPSASEPRLGLITRVGCHLCDVAKEGSRISDVPTFSGHVRYPGKDAGAVSVDPWINVSV